MTGGYTVTVKKEAIKSIARLNPVIQQRIAEVLRSLAGTPRPYGSIPLSGHVNLWRIRLDKIRIIYEIRDNVFEIDIIRVAPRGQAYKGL